jgi:hypothetical protein
MRLTISIVVVLSAAVFALTATPTTALEGAGSRHHFKTHHKAVYLAASEPASQRTCGWVGPGGRAIYQCRDVAVVDFAQTKASAQRTCGWVGPGGRAVYRCQ